MLLLLTPAFAATKWAMLPTCARHATPDSHLVLPWTKLNHEKCPDDAVCTSCLTSSSGIFEGSLRMTTFFLSMSYSTVCLS